MSHTADFEHVLDLENVVGVEYDAESDQVVTFVTQKKPMEELDDDQLVANNLDAEQKSDVIASGEFRALDANAEEMPRAEGGRQDRHRPVVGGISEMNENGTAATGGPFPARVTDTSKGNWADSVSEGDRVRLSNNHVYADVNKAEFGEAILQPSPYDGGTADDKVGEHVGFVPLEDGVTVDLAARSMTADHESDVYHELADDKYGRSIYRDDYAALKGTRLVKTGRTTGVTRGDVQGTSATVKVNYGDAGVFKLTNQLIVSDMSKGGDSGSPVFVDESGAFVGEVFAGSDTISVVHKATGMEEAFGVELETSDDTDSYVESLNRTASIEMEAHDLDLTKLNGDKPKAGETVETEAHVEGNYAGNCWLDVQGERHLFEMPADSRDGDGVYSTTVTVPVTAPDEYQQTFSVTFRGGYVT